MANSTALDLMRAEVLSRLALGHSIRKIQRDLHIGYRKVIAIQSQHQATPSSSTRIAHITPLAYDAVEKTLTTNEWPQAGSLAMRWLENTELRDAPNVTYQFRDDARLQVAIGALLPPLPGSAVPALAAPDAVAVPADTTDTTKATSAASGDAAPPTLAPAALAPAHYCPKCGMLRDPHDAAGRVQLFDRCLCVAPEHGGRARPWRPHI